MPRDLSALPRLTTAEQVLDFMRQAPTDRLLHRAWNLTPEEWRIAKGRRPGPPLCSKPVQVMVSLAKAGAADICSYADIIWRRSGHCTTWPEEMAIVDPSATRHLLTDAYNGYADRRLSHGPCADIWVLPEHPEAETDEAIIEEYGSLPSRPVRSPVVSFLDHLDRNQGVDSLIESIRAHLYTVDGLVDAVRAYVEEYQEEMSHLQARRGMDHKRLCREGRGKREAAVYGISLYLEFEARLALMPLADYAATAASPAQRNALWQEYLRQTADGSLGSFWDNIRDSRRRETARNARRRRWDDPGMDALEAALKSVLAGSGVDLVNQSSVLHMLASDVDKLAIGGSVGDAPS